MLLWGPVGSTFLQGRLARSSGMGSSSGRRRYGLDSGGSMAGGNLHRWEQAGWREPTARGSEGGWVTRTLLFIFVSLSLSHTRVVCELAHPRDPRVWGGNPGRLPSRPGCGEKGLAGGKIPGSAWASRGSGELGARAARCTDLSSPSHLAPRILTKAGLASSFLLVPPSKPE